MISIIIPFKNVNPERARNLQYTVNYYKKYISECEIILSEQDTETDVVNVNKHLKFKTNEDFFKKGFLFNQGYNICNGDYIFFSDADCIVDSFILKNIDQYYSLLNDHILLPYSGNVFYLSKEETEKFINSNSDNDSDNSDRKLDSLRRASGGVVILNNNNFYNVGGFDERFKGWGAEDDAFFNKCIGYGIFYHRINKDLIHLHHPDTYQGYDNYSNNIKIYNENYGCKTSKEIIESLGFNHLVKKEK